MILGFEIDVLPFYLAIREEFLISCRLGGLFGLLGHIDAWTVIWQKGFGIYMIGILGRSY